MRISAIGPSLVIQVTGNSVSSIMGIPFLSYFCTLLLILVVDFVWLKWVAKALYASEMGPLLRKDPNMYAAGAFYFLYAGGLAFFAVAPGIASHSALEATALGAALGLIAYGTYDLTCLSVINGYSARLAMIDIAWGIASSAFASGVAALFLM